MQPEFPRPPTNYVQYTAPPPPRGGIPVWVWVLGGFAACGCLIVPVLAAILFPVFAQARGKARLVTCVTNVRQIALGATMYAQDYDQQYPPAAHWQDAAAHYFKNDRVFHCPAALSGSVPSDPAGTNYAYNRALDRVTLARVLQPASTALAYDSTATARNASDPLTSLPSPGRHIGRNIIGFADGHVQAWPDGRPVPKGEIGPKTR